MATLAPNFESQIPQLASRRDLFSWAANGIGAAAFMSLLHRDAVASAAPVSGEAKDSPPHHPPKAKRVVHICCCGGFSQLDTFDYKLELVKRHGQPLGGDEKPDVFFGQIGLLRQNDFAFQQH